MLTQQMLLAWSHIGYVDSNDDKLSEMKEAFVCSLSFNSHVSFVTFKRPQCVFEELTVLQVNNTLTQHTHLNTQLSPNEIKTKENSDQTKIQFNVSCNESPRCVEVEVFHIVQE